MVGNTATLEPRPIWETSHERSVVYNGATVEPRDIVFIKLYCNFRDVMKDLVGAPLATFICIALHMNGSDTSYPGIRTIAKETGHAINTVQEAIVKLEVMGYIEVKRGGGRMANRYSVKRWATTQPAKNVSVSDTPKQCISKAKQCISQGELCIRAIDTEVDEVEEEDIAAAPLIITPKKPTAKERATARANEMYAPAQPYVDAYLDGDMISDDFFERLRAVALANLKKLPPVEDFRDCVRYKKSCKDFTPFTPASGFSMVMSAYSLWCKHGRPKPEAVKLILRDAAGRTYEEWQEAKMQKEVDWYAQWEPVYPESLNHE
jgi:DNA-binding transcriptional regulator YhcF (GntR family)